MLLKLKEILNKKKLGKVIRRQKLTIKANMKSQREISEIANSNSEESLPTKEKLLEIITKERKRLNVLAKAMGEPSVESPIESPPQQAPIASFQPTAPPQVNPQPPQAVNYVLPSVCSHCIVNQNCSKKKFAQKPKKSSKHLLGRLNFSKMEDSYKLSEPLFPNSETRPGGIRKLRPGQRESKIIIPTKAFEETKSELCYDKKVGPTSRKISIEPIPDKKELQETNFIASKNKNDEVTNILFENNKPSENNISTTNISKVENKIEPKETNLTKDIFQSEIENTIPIENKIDEEIPKAEIIQPLEKSSLFLKSENSTPLFGDITNKAATPLPTPSLFSKPINSLSNEKSIVESKPELISPSEPVQEVTNSPETKANPFMKAYKTKSNLLEDSMKKNNSNLFGEPGTSPQTPASLFGNPGPESNPIFNNSGNSENQPSIFAGGSNNKNNGIFSQPSSGLEPSTPSLFGNSQIQNNSLFSGIPKNDSNQNNTGSLFSNNTGYNLFSNKAGNSLFGGIPNNNSNNDAAK